MNFSYFSSELSQYTLMFELTMLLFICAILYYGVSHYRFFLWRFFALAFGVFCFEGLTGALWDISHLGRFAYIHNDVSWVMTLTWASIILLLRFLYDTFIQKKTLMKEFIFIVSFGSILS